MWAMRRRMYQGVRSWRLAEREGVQQCILRSRHQELPQHIAKSFVCVESFGWNTRKKEGTKKVHVLKTGKHISMLTTVKIHLIGVPLC